MAKVVRGFLLGTHYDLTFYLMDGNLYVRMKSSLSRKKVKYSPRFKRTMQSAEELRRASKLASRIYWELSREQKKRVFVLYKKMTGVAKIAFKYGKSEVEAEREVREYLVREGVVKQVVEEKVVAREEKIVKRKEEVLLAVKNEKIGGNVRKVAALNKAPKVFCLIDEFRTEGTRRTVGKRIKRKSFKDAAKLSRPFTRGSPFEYIKHAGM